MKVIWMRANLRRFADTRNYPGLRVAHGDAFDATLQYTDGCEGTVVTSATLNDEALPNEITGDYTSNDCVGETIGTYRLVRQ